jgi:hypothetical protein
MNILGNNKDKFGYYLVGEFKTYSKVESIELHKITGIHPQWIFNEDVFKLYDWTQEPSESLDQLYLRRAQQIRRDYDHVVLMFSGGADSTNILDTFAKNKVLFEEIVTFNYWKADPDSDSFFHSELHKVAYPKIKSLREQGIDFKHRDFDMSELAHMVLKDPQYLNHRGYMASAHWGTSHIAKTYIRECTPDYQKIMESGKKLVFVWGSDKPRLHQVDGRYCLRFLDLTDGGVNPRTQMQAKAHEYDELFYWAPECADMLCKQGHVLKRYYEKYNIYRQDDYYSDKLIPLPEIKTVFDNDKTEDRLSFRNLINRLIYPGWDTNTFSLGKTSNVLVSSRDKVWNQDITLRIQIDRMIQHLNGLSDYWKNDPMDIYKGLKLCMSPPYFLH